MKLVFCLVFCNDCKFYKCIHDPRFRDQCKLARHMVPKYDRLHVKYRYRPEEINKDNNCPMHELKWWKKK